MKGHFVETRKSEIPQLTAENFHTILTLLNTNGLSALAIHPWNFVVGRLSLEDLEQLCLVLSINTSLSQLIFDGIRMYTEQTPELISKKIDLYLNQFQTLLRKLANTNLTEITLRNFESAGWTNFQKRPSFAAKKIIDAAKENNAIQLKDLAIESYEMTDDDLSSVQTYLSTSNTLRRLCLAGVRLDEEKTEKHLSRALEKNKSLEVLDLYNNFLCDEGATIIAKSIRRHPKLDTLILAHNSIGDRGAIAVAEMLPENPTFQGSLVFYSNNIADEGAKALAKALEKNSALGGLNLYYNVICNVGAAAFLSMLLVNDSLGALGLIKGNYIDTAYLKDMEEICRLRERRTALEKSGNVFFYLPQEKQEPLTTDFLQYEICMDAGNDIPPFLSIAVSRKGHPLPDPVLIFHLSKQGIQIPQTLSSDPILLFPQTANESKLTVSQLIATQQQLNTHFPSPASLGELMRTSKANLQAFCANAQNVTMKINPSAKSGEEKQQQTGRSCFL